VAIDPSVSDTADSDEAGISVVAKGDGTCPKCGKENCAYVMRDLSNRMAPIQWARVGIEAYREFKADRVIGEVNNGGDLVEAQLRVVDANVSYKAVHASRGKRRRAEPVQALYEQGRVHHVGGFPRLEDQMTGWVPDAGMPSPDRMDALVWGLSELMLDDDTGMIDFYATKAAAIKVQREAAAKGH
jgi:phage terminase large subunit-like protein